MKKLLLVLLVLTFLSCEKDKCYICTGKYSHAYHKSKDCKGLDYCGGEIKKISIDSAKSIHRHPCHFCH